MGIDWESTVRFGVHELGGPWIEPQAKIPIQCQVPLLMCLMPPGSDTCCLLVCMHHFLLLLGAALMYLCNCEVMKEHWGCARITFEWCRCTTGGTQCYSEVVQCWWGDGVNTQTRAKAEKSWAIVWEQGRGETWFVNLGSQAQTRQNLVWTFLGYMKVSISTTFPQNAFCIFDLFF